MALFTDTQEMAFGESKTTRSIIVNGSVVVDAYNGTDWILADTLTTGVYQYYTYGLRLRFTPSGGSSYSISEE